MSNKEGAEQTTPTATTSNNDKMIGDYVLGKHNQLDENLKRISCVLR